MKIKIEHQADTIKHRKIVLGNPNKIIKNYQAKYSPSLKNSSIKKLILEN